MEENTVDWYDLDPTKYTNDLELKDLVIGEELVIMDLGSYHTPPKTPCTGILKSIPENFYIIVEIEGKDWEVYTKGFARKL